MGNHLLWNDYIVAKDHVMTVDDESFSTIKGLKGSIRFEEQQISIVMLNKCLVVCVHDNEYSLTIYMCELIEISR